LQESELVEEIGGHGVGVGRAPQAVAQGVVGVKGVVYGSCEGLVDLDDGEGGKV
jgi:hypothetical protein